MRFVLFAAVLIASPALAQKPAKPAPAPHPGAEVYQNICQACHMANALGGEGAGKIPALAKNGALEAAVYPIMVVTGGKNPTGVAKVLVTFFKDFSKLEVKAGVLDSKILTKAEVEVLSKLPSLDGIRAQLLSLLSTPASSLVRLLDAKRQKDETAA